ncbi:MAG: transporter substrate-binding domain-containing protein [Azospirillum sp.]|nr:transporter substrate-binding domain-containing protein [Azospirillum sp.]
MRKLLTALVVGAVMAAVATASVRAETKLKIGVEGAYPPFSQTQPDGSITGFDIDIAMALCAEIKASCELVAQAWDGMIPALQEKKFDAIVASMSITDERKQVVAFTEKYYESPAAYVGPKGVAVDTSMAGLKGKTIGYQSGTVSAAYAEDHLKDVATLKAYDTQENANLDLVSGRIDLLLADLLVLSEGFLKEKDGAGFEIKGKSFTDPKTMGEGIGIALRKEDTDLRAKLNAAIKAIRANGVYKKINDKYFAFDLYGG